MTTDAELFRRYKDWEHAHDDLTRSLVGLELTETERMLVAAAVRGRIHFLQDNGRRHKLAGDEGSCEEHQDEIRHLTLGMAKLGLR